MTAPTPTGATTADAPESPSGDGAPVVDDGLVFVDPQLHAPGQPPGVTGPTRPNIVRAYPGGEDDDAADETTASETAGDDSDGGEKAPEPAKSRKNTSKG